MKITTQDNELQIGQLRMLTLTKRLFLIYSIDGVYAGVIGDNGSTQGFYAKWLEENSVVVHAED